MPSSGYKTKYISIFITSDGLLRETFNRRSVNRLRRGGGGGDFTLSTYMSSDTSFLKMEIVREMIMHDIFV